MVHNLKILVAVSRQQEADTLKSLLENMDGWNIETDLCKDNASLHERIIYGLPDAVFLDSKINIRACIESTHKILASEHNPVFFLLADTMPEKDIIHAFRSGISDYLKKKDLTKSSLSRLLKFNFERKSYITYNHHDVDRFRTIFDQTADGIVLLDYKTLRFIEFNDAAHETLGYSSEEFSLLCLSDIELFKTRKEIQDECLKIVDKNHDIYTSCLSTKDGDVREMLVNSRSVPVNGNIYLQNVWHDVTEFNKSAENYQRALVNLETALGELSLKNETVKIQKDIIYKKNQEIETLKSRLDPEKQDSNMTDGFQLSFLGNLSHELRTPLNSMMLLARLLSDNTEKNLTDKQVEFLEHISHSGKDLLNLINEILDLAKADAGKMQVHIEQVFVSDLEVYFKNMFDGVEKNKQLEFRIIIEKTAPRIIYTDEKKLCQILKNFLSNAFKFTRSGSVTLTFFKPDTLPEGVSIINQENSICFSVEDTGIGIEETKFTEIFKSFAQADRTISRKYGGTGLGLAISKKLSSMLNGEIHLTSECGKGSVFSLYLNEKPEQTDQEKEPEPVNEQMIEPNFQILKHTGDVTDSRRKIEKDEKSILIVENNPTTSHYLMNLCRESGYKVILSKNARSSLFLASFYQPVGIITNTNISKAMGSGALKRVQKNIETRKIPVFMADLDQNMNYLTHFEKEIQDFLQDVGFRKRQIPDTPDYHQILKDKNILIADDDINGVYALKNYLEEMNANVFVSSDGSEALNTIYEHDDMDLVLMDMMMPVLNGYETIEKIRQYKRFSKLPVIAVTAKAMQGDYDRCINAGATDYLTKPVNTKKLCIMLSAWLQ